MLKEEIKNPIRSWIINHSGIINDVAGGHKPDNNPHAVGAQKGENLFKNDDNEEGN